MALSISYLEHACSRVRWWASALSEEYITLFALGAHHRPHASGSFNMSQTLELELLQDH
jgi:hypothetical protein